MIKNVPLSLAGVVLFTALSALQAPRQSFEDRFLPTENESQIAIGSLEDKGISHEQFDAVLDHIEALYAPIVAAQGGTLIINRLWDNDTVNASAQRQGRSYILNMYGGLARHEAITQDGFALVACHELGHHLGGAPKRPTIFMVGSSWASNEGQADYYATLKCLRRVFSDAGSQAFTRAADDGDVMRTACAVSFSEPAEQALCARSSLAGMSAASLFVSKRGLPVPHFDTPDPAIVGKTDNDHPKAQCRLDTYFQGAICRRDASVPVSDQDPAPGACTRSQGDPVGMRPLCWYKPPASEPTGAMNVATVRARGERSIMTLLKNPTLWHGL